MESTGAETTAPLETAPDGDTPIPLTQTLKHPRVVCAICRKLMYAMTEAHLRSHGYTVETYKRVFLCPANPPRARAPELSDQRRGGSDPLANAASIVADPKFIGGVADAIMHGPLRDRLTLSVTALLEVRSRMHGEAVARLEAINLELNKPWRVEQGGPNGAATSVKDLYLMAQVAQSEVRATEELFIKAAKLAVDEAKGKDAAKLSVPDGLDHYTGGAEKIPVPADITSAERETVRTLLAGLAKSITARRARTAAPPIETTATIVPPVAVEPSAPRAPMDVIRERVRVLTSPTTEPIPPVSSLTTPMREADEPF